jgi:DNA-binding GntR family transcriptional regulator
MFGDLTKKTLTEQIYDKLRYDITRKIIRSDEKIDIAVLKKKWDISQTPIREALMKLEQEGLVEFIANVGVRVIKIDKTSISEVFDVNMVIDSGAIILAMGSDRFDQLVQELRQHVDAQASIVNMEPTEEYWYEAEHVHSVFYDYTGNAELKKIMRQARGKYEIFFGEYILSDKNRYSAAEEHRMIYEAVKEHNPEKAVELMRLHWTNAKHRLIEWCDQRSGGA